MPASSTAMTSTTLILFAADMRLAEVKRLKKKAASFTSLVRYLRGMAP